MLMRPDATCGGERINIFRGEEQGLGPTCRLAIQNYLLRLGDWIMNVFEWDEASGRSISSSTDWIS